MCTYYLVYWLNVIDPQTDRKKLLRGIRRHGAVEQIDIPTWNGVA
jgi:hypothetical protein